MQGPDDVLKFWLDETKPSQWYNSSPAFDEEIRTRFQTTWQAAKEGSLSMWLTYASGTLAYIILTDQFPRNMFRDSGKAFSTDTLALTAAKAAIARKWDLRIDSPARQFFYLPLMHSECLSDQEHAVRMFVTRMPDQGGSNLLHAKAHRHVIRQFGRFPYRNDALGRKTTPSETAYLEGGSYRSTVVAMEAALAARADAVQAQAS